MVQHSAISHTGLPGAIVLHDEGTTIGTATAGINFVGSGVAGTVTSGTAVITISGTATANTPFFDEGVNKGTATAGINIVGSYISGTVTSGTAIITAALPPGHQFDYVEKTTQVTVAGTAEGGETTVVTGSSVAYDGSTAVWIEFFCPRVAVSPSAAGRGVIVTLYEDSTVLGRFGLLVPTFVSGLTHIEPMKLERKVTPSNASHTYTVKAWKSTSGDVVTFDFGNSGSGVEVPGFIRITKA